MSVSAGNTFSPPNQDSVTVITIFSETTITPPVVSISTTYFVVVIPEGSTTLTITTIHASTVSNSPTTAPFSVSSLPGPYIFSTASDTLFTSPTSVSNAAPSTSLSTILSTSPSINITIAHSPSSSKATGALLGTLIPLILIFLSAMFWLIRRYRKQSGNHQMASYPIAFYRWICRSIVESPQPVTPPAEIQEVKKYHPSPPPPIPPRSQLRNHHRPPPRPPRPASISESIMEAIRAHPPGSTWTEIGEEYEETPLEYHNMTALGNSSEDPDDITSFNKFHHSLGITNKLQISPKGSLTPEPLKIIERSLSDGTGYGKSTPYVTNLDNLNLVPSEPLASITRGRTVLAAVRAERAMGWLKHNQPRNVQFDPLAGNSRACLPLSENPAEISDEDLGGHANLDDGSIDEVEKERKIEETLRYLEGVHPMSPPLSYGRRPSSIYSIDDFGTPSPGLANGSLAREGFKFEIERSRRRQGKDNAWSSLESNWI